MTDTFEQLLNQVSGAFSRIKSDVPIFRTDAHDLYDTFLDHLPENVRPEYRCSLCRSFFIHYAGLAVIDPTSGALHSAVFSLQNTPQFFAEAVQAVITAVEGANITQLFATENHLLGHSTTGAWKHFSIVVPQDRVYHRILPLKKYITEQAVNFRSVMNAIQKYTPDDIRKAITILRTVPAGTRFIPRAQWFLTILNGPQQENLVRLAVTQAPTGYCRINPGLLASILDDIKGGRSDYRVRGAILKKTNALEFRRQRRPARLQTLQRAPMELDDLGISPSFNFRYASLADIKSFWPIAQDAQAAAAPAEEAEEEKATPTAASAPAAEQEMAEQEITFDDFLQTVVPTATSIEYNVPAIWNSYGAIITVVDPTSKPVLKWDNPDNRNPTSWYVYPFGSNPVDWQLPPDSFVAVTAICNLPRQWDVPQDGPHGKGVFLLLDNAEDHNSSTTLGTPIFPEALVSDVKQWETAIVHKLEHTPLQPAPDAPACGLFVGSEHTMQERFRVTTPAGTRVYITRPRTTMTTTVIPSLMPTGQKALVHNALVIDQSGSMNYFIDGVKTSFHLSNSQLNLAQSTYHETQDHDLSLMFFSLDSVQWVFKRRHITQVSDNDINTYEPNGATPLYDAIGAAIKEFQPELEQQPNVFLSLVVVTDGADNTSRNYTPDSLTQLIQSLPPNRVNLSFFGPDNRIFPSLVGCPGVEFNVFVPTTASLYPFSQMAFAQRSQFFAHITSPTHKKAP